MAIILKDNFLDVGIEIRKTYFPDVIHGTTENPKYYNSIYYLECFSNGVWSYNKLIIELHKKTKGSLKDLMKIVDKYIVNQEIL